jgi:sulfur-oxidizing protein SoxY
MAGRFVRASGGCAAPAGKDAEATLAHLGEMRFQQAAVAADPSGLLREGKLMLRHPNYSGLQRDQVTLLTIPARFIDILEVRQGEDLLFTMTGGISISEDPVFTFRYRDNGAGQITVRAVDTDGAEFGGTFPVPAG